eukprot:NODE_200_length_15202_cov_0.356618.p9 type:complete len:140 gc:universal NODE_200_length_15202_cov_0.356618:5417-5836(+)
MHRQCWDHSLLSIIVFHLLLLLLWWRILLHIHHLLLLLLDYNLLALLRPSLLLHHLHFILFLELRYFINLWLQVFDPFWFNLVLKLPNNSYHMVLIHLRIYLNFQLSLLFSSLPRLCVMRFLHLQVLIYNRISLVAVFT